MDTYHPWSGPDLFVHSAYRGSFGLCRYFRNLRWHRANPVLCVHRPLHRGDDCKGASWSSSDLKLFFRIPSTTMGRRHPPAALALLVNRSAWAGHEKSPRVAGLSDRPNQITSCIRATPQALLLSATRRPAHRHRRSGEGSALVRATRQRAFRPSPESRPHR